MYCPSQVWADLSFLVSNFAAVNDLVGPVDCNAASYCNDARGVGYFTWRNANRLHLCAADPGPWDD